MAARERAEASPASGELAARLARNEGRRRDLHDRYKRELSGQQGRLSREN